MCYIELKNEKYETLEDLKRLLHYILRLDKTAEDSQRANTITNTLAGCQPAMIPNEYLCDPSSVYHLMLFEVRRRHKGIPQFAKHRIVSFAATDCILPQDVVSLAERIASIYAKNGYITAYGIHADRGCFYGALFHADLFTAAGLRIVVPFRGGVGIRHGFHGFVGTVQNRKPHFVRNALNRD